MVKPEWGRKRICFACGALYYDMGRAPPKCPKCDTKFDPEAILKSRRTRVRVVENDAAKAATPDKSPADDATPDKGEDDKAPAKDDTDAEPHGAVKTAEVEASETVDEAPKG